MESVRRARAGDIPRCAELIASALDELKARRGGSLLLAAGDGLGDYVSSPHRPSSDPEALLAAWSAGGGDRVLLAGLFDGSVVGVAAGHVRRGGRDGGGDRQPPIGFVDCCYVEPDARLVGVGGSLAHALIEWFTKKGCAGVDVLALPGDRSAKRVFEAAGFNARLLVLHRPLP